MFDGIENTIDDKTTKCRTLKKNDKLLWHELLELFIQIVHEFLKTRNQKTRRSMLFLYARILFRFKFT